MKKLLGTLVILAGMPLGVYAVAAWVGVTNAGYEYRLTAIVLAVGLTTVAFLVFLLGVRLWRKSRQIEEVE